MKTYLQLLFSVLICFLIAGHDAIAQERQLLTLGRGSMNITSVPVDHFGDPMHILFHDSIIAAYDMIVDSSTAKIYWSTRFPSRIIEGDLHTGDFHSVISGIGLAVDLDIDYIHQKIYWADIINNRIYRSDLDGTNQEVVGQDTFTNLTCVAVFPSHDLMFMASLDSISIWSSTLDGENRTTIMHEDEGYPVRITLDTINQKLYWSDDGRNRIERINFDGSDRELVYQGMDGEYILGLYMDLQDNNLYWTDYGKNQVGRINVSSLVSEIILTGIDDAQAVAIFSGDLLMKSDDEVQIKSGLFVYPNPSTGYINFELTTPSFGDKNIRITDLSGRVVLLEKIDDKHSMIDMHTFPSGIYWYELITDDQSYSGKILISNQGN